MRGLSRTTWGALALCALALVGALASHTPHAQSREAAPSTLPTWVFSAAARVVAVGDLHGDLAATRRALRLAGAIDDTDRWIGGPLVLVQTGDQLDRGDDDRAVQELLERIQPEATRAGGRLVILNGNHELMNASGDFRYVSQRSFAGYADLGGDKSSDISAGRRAAFAPGGAAAKTLAQRPIVAVVGVTLFAHGGVLLSHVQYGLERLNREASAFLLGTAPLPAAVQADDAPIWTRLYSNGQPNAEACAQLREVLKRTNTRRLVVGHTVQPEINSACDGKVWRIDVGMSAHYHGPTQVLEIRKDALQVLKAEQPVTEPAAR